MYTPKNTVNCSYILFFLAATLPFNNFSIILLSCVYSKCMHFCFCSSETQHSFSLIQNSFPLFIPLPHYYYFTSVFLLQQRSYKTRNCLQFTFLFLFLFGVRVWNGEFLFVLIVYSYLVQSTLHSIPRTCFLFSQQYLLSNVLICFPMFLESVFCVCISLLSSIGTCLFFFSNNIYIIVFIHPCLVAEKQS